MVGIRKKNRHLPARVYFHRGWHFYVDYLGRWHKLGREWNFDAKMKYADLSGNEPVAGTVAELINAYLRDVSPTMSANTRRDHELQKVTLLAVFGKMLAKDVTSSHVAQYLQKRTDKHGKRAPVRANREMALLSSVYNHAMRCGVPGVILNPCYGVRRNTEHARTRYVSDAELNAAMNAANDKWRAILQIMYSCGQRPSDIRTLKRSQLTEEGIHFEPAKTAKRTGAKVIVQWSPDLRAAVDKLLAMQSVSNMYVITAKGHGCYTEAGFKVEFRKIIDKAIAAGTLSKRFWAYDLRAKAASDDEESAQDRLAHSSSTQTMTYLRGRKSKTVKGL
jgi:integrase